MAVHERMDAENAEGLAFLIGAESAREAREEALLLPL